jgi:hypothetical protein
MSSGSRRYRTAPCGGKKNVLWAYDAPTGAGKTTARTDTYHGRFVKRGEMNEAGWREALATLAALVQAS